MSFNQPLKKANVFENEIKVHLSSKTLKNHTAKSNLKLNKKHISSTCIRFKIDEPTLKINYGNKL